MEDFPIEENILKQFVSVIEQYSYDDVQKYINDLSRDNTLMHSFWINIYNGTIFGRLSSHKNQLAILLAKQSRVMALPEDRIRIVFTLAKLTNSTLDVVNRVMSQEFGPFFKIFPNYNIGNTVKTWQELANKAKEIVNGYYNYNLLYVQEAAKETFELYKLFSVNSPNQLYEIIRTGPEVSLTLSKLDFLQNLDSNESTLVEKIRNLLKTLNRTQLEIENVNKDYIIREVDQLIRIINQSVRIAATKLYFIQNKIPLDNYDTAKQFILENYAQDYFTSYISTDEFKRINQPLQPVAAPPYANAVR